MYVRFVPNEFVERLGTSDGIEVQLDDHQSSSSGILFRDIRSCTTMSEIMTWDETFLSINKYLTPVVQKKRMYR